MEPYTSESMLQPRMNYAHKKNVYFGSDYTSASAIYILQVGRSAKLPDMQVVMAVGVDGS